MARRALRRQGTIYAVVTTALLTVGLFGATLPWHDSWSVPQGSGLSPEVAQQSGALILERTCTGLDHLAYGGDLLLYGAALLHVLALLAWRRERLAYCFGLGAAGLVAGALLFVEDVWLGRPHVLYADVTTLRAGQAVFVAALAAYILAPLVHRAWRFAVSRLPSLPEDVRTLARGERALAVAGAVAALVALLGYVLPWHDVRGIRGGIGQALAAGFIPDYHPDLSVGLLGTCTGRDHAGPLCLVLVLALLALEGILVAGTRAAVRRTLALAAFCAALLAGIVGASGSVVGMHLFEQVTQRAGGYVFAVGLAGCIGVTAFQAFRRRRR